VVPRSIPIAFVILDIGDESDGKCVDEFKIEKRILTGYVLLLYDAEAPG
jgi:hypothetical protein